MSEIVSVLIPLYNAQQYIEATLQSIANQTYHEIKVIMVDDGSVDDTVAVCRKWVEADERFSIFCFDSNQGVCSARNKLLELADSDFLMFVDADDVLQSDMIERMVNLQQEYSADIVSCSLDCIYSQDKLVVDNSCESGYLNQEEALRVLLRGRPIAVGMPSKLFRTSIFLGLNFKKGLVIGEDALMAVDLFLRSNGCAYTTAKLYKYLQRDNSAMHKPFNLQVLKDFIAVHELNARKIVASFPNLALVSQQRVAYARIHVLDNFINTWVNNPQLLTEEDYSFAKNLRKELVGSIFTIWRGDYFKLKRKLAILLLPISLRLYAKLVCNRLAQRQTVS